MRIDAPYIDTRQKTLVPSRFVILAVKDNGHGDTHGHSGEIPEPVFTTKPTGVGSGLGLSMVVGFVKQPRGTVQVYSELDKGTTLKPYFPAKSAPHFEPSDSVRSKYNEAVRKIRVLIAEVEEDARNTWVKVLERAGYQVTAAPAGEAVFAIFEADPIFDLVLTDIVLSGSLQGRGVAKASRKQ